MERQHRMNIIPFNITLYSILFNVIINYIPLTFNILFLFTKSYPHNVEHIHTPIQNSYQQNMKQQLTRLNFFSKHQMKYNFVNSTLYINKLGKKNSQI